MKNESSYSSLQQIFELCIAKGCAMVAYRKPNGDEVNVMVANSADSFLLNTQPAIFQHKGFLFSPFDNVTQSTFFIAPNYFFPLDDVPTTLTSWLSDKPDNHYPHQKIEAETTFETYQKGFDWIHQNISNGKIEKAILSRIQVEEEVIYNQAVTYFEAINNSYKTSFNYLLFTPDAGIWMGASPELFLQLKNQQGITVSLAGTMPSAQKVEWKNKEVEEQNIVTQFIQEMLQQSGATQITAKPPQTVSAGKIAHLKTIFNFEFHQPENILNLITALHPTPAVCGVPKSVAKNIIADAENHNRAFYAGFLGEVNNGDVELYVNIRCMQLFANGGALYVGGGITIDSEVNAEFNETKLKANVLLDAIHTSATKNLK